MISSILKMHNHQYEQFDVESLDFIKLALQVNVLEISFWGLIM